MVDTQYMAHTKAQGSVKGNRDSNPKKRGIKVYGGAKVISGNIIVRQKGTKFYSGAGTDIGNDYTIFAKVSGTVSYRTLKGKRVVEVHHE